MRTNLKQGRFIPPSSKEVAVARIKQLEHEIESITKQLSDTSQIADRLREHPEAYEEWADRANNRRNEFRKELRYTETWLAGWNAHEKAGADLIKGMLDFLQALRKDDAIEPEELPFIEKFEAFFQQET